MSGGILSFLIAAVLPIALVAVPKARRSNRGLAWASGLAVLGVMMNRVDVGIVGYFRSAGTVYVPSLAELALTLGIPAAVCGEAAGDRRYTRLLLALGLREFSMYPARLLEIKQAVRQTDIARAQAALTRWLHDPESRSGRTLIEALDESQH